MNKKVKGNPAYCFLLRSDGIPWAHIADASGVGADLFYSRRARGWPCEKAATAPLGAGPSRRKLTPPKDDPA